MTDRKTGKLRLNDAGYDCLNDVWVPAAYAAEVLRQADLHLARVEHIRAAPRPRGRPRKTPAQTDAA